MPNLSIIQANPALFINAFFLYSFMGWVMECVVIRREKGEWENRGFAHLPFCIIYGFGAMLGYMVLKPFSGNWVLLYVASALIATVFEYITARLMLRLFGAFWWNYENKPFNYKGILCLESTLGWGIIGILLFAGMHKGVFYMAGLLPQNLANALAFVLVCAYAGDFAFSMRRALQKASEARADVREEETV
ncbi:MAG: putative ABC transporter permease [Oscillospiraceae bacterium]|nr:putative ABC transporter permease [Oscillospiraceae bacterium]